MTRQSCEDIELIHRFRQLRVLVIGDVLLDTYLEGEAARLSREGPVPVIHRTVEQHIPGGAANVAANVRALEAEVALLSLVGCDEAGRQLRAALRTCGVNDVSVLDDKASTPQKLRLLADGQYIIHFDSSGKHRGHSSLYTPASQHRLLALGASTKRGGAEK